MRKIILFELNEIPQKILEHYSALEPNSHVARLMKKADVYTTYTEDRSKNLSPWITWPTVHRGVIDSEHNIYNFGQINPEVDNAFPNVWEILRKNRVNVGVFGSLHSYDSYPATHDELSFYFPDTFAAGPECFPKKLVPFQDFNLSMVKNSGMTVSSGISVKKALPLIKSAKNLGITTRTVGSVIEQLGSEIVSPWKKIRRRSLQAVLAFDIFMKQLQTHKPSFVTFFTNHLASTMHRFWGASFPDEYESKYGVELDSDWKSRYGREIYRAMTLLDKFIGRLMCFLEKNTDYDLWVCSSMGQDSVPPDYKSTSLYLDRIEVFLSKFGLRKEDYEVKPSMYPRFNMVINNNKADYLEKCLSNFTILGKNLDICRSNNFFMLKFNSFDDIDTSSPVICYDNREYNIEEFGISSKDREDSKLATAYHIPQGVLMVYSGDGLSGGKFRDFNEEISTTDIAPAILRNFSITPPNYMRNSVIT